MSTVRSYDFNLTIETNNQIHAFQGDMGSKLLIDQPNASDDQIRSTGMWINTMQDKCTQVIHSQESGDKVSNVEILCYMYLSSRA